ncbi:NAD(P)/FAD-dependent oxidoreductase [Pararhodobacter sp.]|uniref:NAD(P)/FAD-dependent oxidoreductase n=1 Tax=Pararhodobacter sp. TaxID=2127056 RepID=UPI002FE2645C
MTEPDLLIIGGGIAGLSAAATARDLGLSVTLADERPAPGGNMLAGAEAPPKGMASALTRRGAGLIAAARAADCRAATQALRIDADLAVQLVTSTGPVETLHPKRLLLATGAVERPVPLPGATLPGVMMAGAAQLLLKTSGAMPAGRTILAGSGPLLLLVARQLLAAGVRPVALVETTPRQSLGQLVATLPAARHAPGLVVQGAGMMLALRRAGVPWFRQASALTIQGTGRVETLRFHDAKGQAQELAADLVLLHDGVIPQDQATRLLHCAEDWHPGRQAYEPRADLWGETSRAGVFVAGDCAGVRGALAAEQAGILAALQIAHQLGRIDAGKRDALAREPRRLLHRQAAFRPFLDSRFPPRLADPAGAEESQVICRCEGVTAGALRMAIRQGATGADQLKSFTRCGMGRCQGRNCALAMTRILASETGTAMEDLRRQGVRAPLKPVPLGQIAQEGEA